MIKKGHSSSKKQKKRQRETRKHGVQPLQTKNISDSTHTGCDTEQKLHSQSLVLVHDQRNKDIGFQNNVSQSSADNASFDKSSTTSTLPVLKTGDSCFFIPALSLDMLFSKKPTSCSQTVIDPHETTFDVLDDFSSDKNIDLLSNRHGPDSKILEKINALWIVNYPTAGFRSCSSVAADEIQHPARKVNFATDPHFLTVHSVGTEERNGKWHHAIRERENFERRILEMKHILTPVLGASHRVKVLQQRKKSRKTLKEAEIV